MKDDIEIQVSDTDELSVAGGREADHTRRLCDYKPTNAPLSADEIAHRIHDWPPQSTDHVDEVVPLPEEEFALDARP